MINTSICPHNLKKLLSLVMGPLLTVEVVQLKVTKGINCYLKSILYQTHSNHSQNNTSSAKQQKKKQGKIDGGDIDAADEPASIMCVRPRLAVWRVG